MRSIDEIIKEVEPWQGAKTITYEPFGGGMTNHTYKVMVDDTAYVLRINGNQNEFLGLDRASEVAVVMQAHAFGFGPKVLQTDNTGDYLITEYQTDPPISGEQARQPEMLTRMAQTLKQIHSMDSALRERQCTPFSLIRGYLNGIEQAGIPLPNRLRPHLQRMDTIEAQRKQDPQYGRVYCHNDYFHFNMLYGEKVTVLDWELSGYGDPFLDLATMPYAIEFTPDEEEHWLTSYFGSCDDAMMRTLLDMKFIGIMREVGWALFHAVTEMDSVNHEVDYADFAKRMMDDLDNGRYSAT